MKPNKNASSQLILSCKNGHLMWFNLTYEYEVLESLFSLLWIVPVRQKDYKEPYFCPWGNLDFKVYLYQVIEKPMSKTHSPITQSGFLTLPCSLRAWAESKKLEKECDRKSLSPRVERNVIWEVTASMTNTIIKSGSHVKHTFFSWCWLS